MKTRRVKRLALDIEYSLRSNWHLLDSPPRGNLVDGLPRAASINQNYDYDFYENFANFDFS